ncbi:hypothetical protein F5879DRAFT_989285 [Lentinula edodes]|nr:hypothetical protein F5879DRAFT_989285 [Lentinula edodes]
MPATQATALQQAQIHRLIVPLPQDWTPMSGIPLGQAQVSTDKNSNMGTSTTVQTLFDSADRLQHIYRAFELWDRMEQFALGLVNVVPGPNFQQGTRQGLLRAFPMPNLGPHLQPHPQELPTWPSQHDIQTQVDPNLPPVDSAWTLRPGDSLPSLRTQLKHAAFLRAWFEAHLQKPSVIMVSSEPAVQDQFFSQFLEPINAILKTRFDITQNYPLWGRAVQKYHRNVANLRTLNGGLRNEESSAGMPDFINLASETEHNSRGVGEVKTFWSYPTATYNTIFLGNMVDDDGNFVSWTVGKGLVPKMIKQIWGEVVMFNSRFGFWTNGHIVFLFVRTSPHDLTFSHAHLWTNPHVFLHCWTGFDDFLMDAPSQEF